MKASIITSITIGLISQLGFSQTIDKQKLDTYFSQLESNNKFMGSVAVSQNGTLLYTKSIGYTDVEKAVKSNADSKFRIGSISKMFTSVLILKAAEENKISLNQTIDKYFPAITNANKITITNLLSHRSGIHNFTSDETYLTWNTKPKTREELVDLITKGGSDFEPDSKSSYSNSNFVLLTVILEKMYNKPYAKLLETKIIQPLGLKNTFFGGAIDTKKNEANSYDFENKWNKETETDMSIPLGAGAIVSTPSDLTKFGEALFNGKLISAQSLEEMKTLRDKYGLGLFSIPLLEKKGYGHSGSIDGFKSHLTYFPDEKITVAITSNGENYDSKNIVTTLTKAAYKQEFEVPDFKAYKVESKDLDQYLGTYATTEIPLKLTITKEGTVLFAQGTGQPSFPLDATGKHKFTFDKVGVVMEFNPETKTLLLIQRGKELKFTKE
ncbi:beta-lactamase family protein [Flavobacterium amniphilum]|uniref:serine hydrolase domain-containing protein n=1 Tax=Flavobacterium amniphilum TaxID=1834035 RepID=UPI002029CD7D|nr:serine hydrolase domain-containing protein [Flavobacterium amniphilum]MCL9805007.1 beta-lactamase family protein [Flavobacterium amniphilum]